MAVPVPRWAFQVGEFLMRAETELILMSRRVVLGRLVEAGFVFRYPSWGVAAANLLQRR